MYESFVSVSILLLFLKKAFVLLLVVEFAANLIFYRCDISL